MKNEYECRRGEPRQGRGQAVPKEPPSSAKAAAISTAETHVCALMNELKDIADALHAVHAVAEFSLRKEAR